MGHYWIWLLIINSMILHRLILHVLGYNRIKHAYAFARAYSEQLTVIELKSYLDVMTCVLPCRMQ